MSESFVAIGSCSLCGGPVYSPVVWHATIPPPVRCANWGAYSVGLQLPVITMYPAPATGTGTGTEAQS